MPNNRLRIILKYALSSILLGAGVVLPAAAQQDVPASARRLAATTQLAAQEYRLGVSGGRVVAQAEVDEAKLFLAEARRNADHIPEPAAAPARVALHRLYS